VTLPRRIDEVTLQEGVRELAVRDADLARVLARYGPPPLWPREPGFGTLVRIVLEQQVSLASGEAAYQRLVGAVPSLTPATLAATDTAVLERAGLTRQKTRYLRELSSAIRDGRLDLEGIAAADDHHARLVLCSVPGIGPWTADVYLLMALGRPDVWPVGDVALATSLARVKSLTARPTPREMERLAEPWHPLRAVAARLLWHAYLEERSLTRS
jgi:DNA-3-methyladenine glycosylase II